MCILFPESPVTVKYKRGVGLQALQFQLNQMLVNIQFAQI